ncbi:MAG: delta-60 repeat domain-containing protein [Bacteroidia bacterium]|nr:delta-60 repeat domain-containing protein [Bacteroidia bacterium]
MKKITLLFGMIVLLNVNPFAQSGSIDLSFNPGTGTTSTIFTTAIQSDGKIIIGGAFTSYNGTAINRIARLNTDGTLDGTYNPGTGASSTVRTTSIQSDGKIIIGGDFASYNGTAINYIARLNADGTLDGTFNPGTGADNDVYTTAIQSDGKIIIGGNFTSYNGTARNYIARLNTDGTLDGTPIMEQQETALHASIPMEPLTELLTREREQTIMSIQPPYKAMGK